MFRATEGRWGSREIEIVDVSLTGPDGERAHVFHSGEPLDVRLRLRAPLAIEDFVVGIGIFNAEGVCCYGTNTDIEDLKAERIFGDADAVFSIESLDLVEGTYKLDVAIHKADGYPYDYHRLLHTFRVKSRTKDVGIYRPRHSWQFSEGMTFTRRTSPASPTPPEAMKVEGAGVSRVLSREKAVELVAAFREAKKTVVFTNGVFDLLHPGHVRYLDVARSLGDALILGLNADASVRRNKGPARPITPERERAEVVAALSSVDAVVIFDEDTPAAIVEALQPDILVKGADWPADQIVGRDTVEARGGRVVLVPVEQGHSTTSIVERVRRSSLR